MYYVALPLVYVVPLDGILKRKFLTPVYVVGWATVIGTRGNFAESCDGVFGRSVAFLNWYAILGMSYVVGSTAICVLLPRTARVLMLRLAFPVLRLWVRAAAAARLTAPLPMVARRAAERIDGP